MNEYIPIACKLHSEYELAIMQGRSLRLSWRDAQQTRHTGTVMPLDLFTHAGAEFLRVRDTGRREHDIRLDWISACEFSRTGFRHS